MPPSPLLALDRESPAVLTPGLEALKFVKMLQARYSNQLGFLPAQAIEEYLCDERIRLVKENDQDAGYLLARHHLRQAPWCRPIIQAAICFDAQRRHLGLALIRDLEINARRDNLLGLQAWVAMDIDAVGFFSAAGFSLVCTRNPKNARGRLLGLFRKHWARVMPQNFLVAPLVAGYRPTRLNGDHIAYTAITPP